MKKVDLGKVPPALTSLGVGGTVGTSLGIAAFYALPALAAHGLSVQFAATAGAALMTALHRATLAAAPTARYYFLMTALVLDVRLGWMTIKEARLIRSQLQQDYYLGQRDLDRGVPRAARRTGHFGAGPSLVISDANSIT